MSTLTNEQRAFLRKLQDEARLQARLTEKRILPHQLDWFTSLVGRRTPFVLLVASCITAIVIELL